MHAFDGQTDRQTSTAIACSNRVRCALKTQVGGGGGHGGGGTLPGSISSAQQQAARKVTKMCIAVATTFTVAWLPYQLTLVMIHYGNKGHALLIIDTVMTLAYVNSCVNPIIYALMWRPFRLSLIQVRLGLSAILRSCLQKNRFTHCFHPPVTLEPVIQKALHLKIMPYRTF